MHKRAKKMTLHRETLRSLDPKKLTHVAGGSGTPLQDKDTHFDHTCGTVCDIPSWHC
jgi:hypothetical protein